MIEQVFRVSFSKRREDSRYCTGKARIKERLARVELRRAVDQFPESGNLGEMFFVESEAVYLLCPVFNGTGGGELRSERT